MWFVYTVGALLALIVLILALKRTPKPPSGYRKVVDNGDIGLDIPKTGKSTMHDNSPYGRTRDIYRDGGTIGFRRDLDEPWKRAAANLRKHPPVEAKSHPRPTAKSPAFSAPYGRKPAIVLSPRQLERVNIQRRLAGRQPLNRAGFSNAIAHAWDQPRRQPDTSSDWLTYLILYQCFLSDHQQHRVAVDHFLAIDPDLPYNGHGGEFAGAGASGSWEGSTAAAGLGFASGIAGIDAYSNAGPDTGQAPEPAPERSAPAYSAPEPSPGYSAPEPSYSAPDSGSSSSSYDSGSSSGGGDSGGGGGD